MDVFFKAILKKDEAGNILVTVHKSSEYHLMPDLDFCGATTQPTQVAALPAFMLVL